MSERTFIEWCDSTFNPVIGCTKVSPGCVNCYAEVSSPSKVFEIEWGDDKPRHVTSDENWKEPVRWNTRPLICDECGMAHGLGVESCQTIVDECGTPCGSTSFHRRRVFCASLSDWLDGQWPDQTLADLLQLMFVTQDMDWLMLSKRMQNWKRRLHRIWDSDLCQYGARPWVRDWLDGNPPANVWLGTSVEDQERADQRIPLLHKIPARVRFLSAEPLLGPITFRTPADLLGISWIITGGESGKNARPCSVDWIRSIVQQCAAANVPCFVKQLGSRPERGGIGIHYNMKHPKGGDIEEFPVDLRIRQHPVITTNDHHPMPTMRPSHGDPR